MSLIVTSWGILLARLFENVVLIEWIAIISLLIILGLGALTLNVTTVQFPELISVAALFSPLYWIFEILDFVAYDVSAINRWKLKARSVPTRLGSKKLVILLINKKSPRLIR